jgi:hypothetical protein
VVEDAMGHVAQVERHQTVDGVDLAGDGAHGRVLARGVTGEGGLRLAQGQRQGVEGDGAGRREVGQQMQARLVAQEASQIGEEGGGRGHQRRIGGQRRRPLGELPGIVGELIETRPEQAEPLRVAGRWWRGCGGWDFGVGHDGFPLWFGGSLRPVWVGGDWPLILPCVAGEGDRRRRWRGRREVPVRVAAPSTSSAGPPPP